MQLGRWLLFISGLFRHSAIVMNTYCTKVDHTHNTDDLRDVFAVKVVLEFHGFVSNRIIMHHMIVYMGCL